MNVYILYEWQAYEGGYGNDVFSSLKLAQESGDKFIKESFHQKPVWEFEAWEYHSRAHNDAVITRKRWTHFKDKDKSWGYTIEEHEVIGSENS